MKDVAWFFQDLYFANIYFVPGMDEASISEFIKDQFGLDWEAKTRLNDGKTIEVEGDSNYGIIIWVSSKDKSTRNLQALTHECLHATNMVLSRAGVSIDIDKNDEAQAYLLGWIFAKCLEYLYEGDA